MLRKTREIQSVLDLLLSRSKVKDIEVKQDPARIRPSDVEILQGDYSKFKEAKAGGQKFHLREQWKICWIVGEIKYNRAFNCRLDFIF